MCSMLLVLAIDEYQSGCLLLLLCSSCTLTYLIKDLINENMERRCPRLYVHVTLDVVVELAEFTSSGGFASNLTSSFIQRSSDEQQVHGSVCASPQHILGRSFQKEKLFNKEAVRACMCIYASINFYRHVAVQ